MKKLGDKGQVKSINENIHSLNSTLLNLQIVLGMQNLYITKLNISIKSVDRQNSSEYMLQKQ